MNVYCSAKVSRVLGVRQLGNALKFEKTCLVAGHLTNPSPVYPAQPH